MDTLLTSIALTALTAVTILAYKHHHAFRPIGNVLRIVFPAALLTAFVWDSSNHYLYISLIKFIDLNKLAEASAASDQIRILNWRIFVGYLAVTLYIEFLFVLPHLLQVKNDPPEPKRQPKDD